MHKIMPIVCLVLLALSLPVAALERTLLVVGDSLSAGYGIPPERGWVSLLQQRLAQETEPWRVVNSSISGETTAGGLARLPQLLQRHEPGVVIIELGSNDGLRGFSFEQMQTNLQEMIDMTKRRGGRVLLVGGRLPPNYGSAYADKFHQLFHQVAEAEQIPLTPFLLEGVAQDRSLMQADGYHPTAQAQPLLLENVWPALETLLVSLSRNGD